MAGFDFFFNNKGPVELGLLHFCFNKKTVNSPLVSVTWFKDVKCLLHTQMERENKEKIVVIKDLFQFDKYINRLNM